MQTAEELKSLLDRIDHRGYPAYKGRRGSTISESIYCPLTMYRETRLHHLPG